MQGARWDPGETGAAHEARAVREGAGWPAPVRSVVREGAGWPAPERSLCARCGEPLGEVRVVLVRHRGEHRIPDAFCSVDHMADWAKSGGRYG